MKPNPAPYFRWVISRACFQWMLQTDEEWYLRETREEIIALKDRLKQEWETEMKGTK